MLRIETLLVLLLAAIPRTDARADSDLDLLGTQVAPNVMVLMDNSGSMSHAVWHADFDRTLFHDSAAVVRACSIGSVAAIAGSDGICPLSGDVQGRCPDNAASIRGGSSIYCRRSSVAAGCGAAPAGWTCSSSGGHYRFILPEITPGPSRTRWSRNYLSWIFAGVISGATAAGIPGQDRLTTAQASITDLVDAINPSGGHERVRFGLAKFRTGRDPGGGEIDTPIATGNRDDFIAAVSALQPTTWTPLAETLVDVGEYMSGDASVGSCTASGVSTPNPMTDDGICRRNFAIVLTDGEPTRDDFDHSGGRSDFMCAIGNADGDDDESPDEYAGRSDAPPYQAEGTDWLDDVAWKLRAEDLRSDLAGEQNIITYTVGFSIDHPLLRDTAQNGHGSYYVADDAAELAAALEDALLDVIERSTSFTAAVTPSTRSSFADGLYSAWFLPRATQPFWEGHLEAYRLSESLEILDRDGNSALDANGEFVEPRRPFWDLAERLLDPGHPVRSLYTTRDGVRTDFQVATIGAADLSVQDSELSLYPNDPASPFASREALADAIVDYLSGSDAFDDNRDGDTAERRDAVLGDIFHSTPVVIGTPPRALSHEEGFGPADRPDTFLALHEQRPRRVYVGANDGMLHAVEAGSYHPGDDPSTTTTESGYYDAGTGNEVFAWVPGVQLERIKLVPRNSPRAHDFVDGSPAAADAWLPASRLDTHKDGHEWSTVLVTGMRRGGDGYLALDVTDPSAVGGAHGPYPKLLWELDGAAEPFGETWSDPVLTRVKVRAGPGFGDHCGADDGDGDCREQWVAIVGGGYDRSGDPVLPTFVSDPNDPGWTAAGRAVFAIALDTGQVLGRLVRDPAHASLRDLHYVLPSTAAVADLDFDGFADVLYVGDTGGQLWKWDLSAVGEDTDADGYVDLESWPAGIFFSSGAADVRGEPHYRSVFFPPSLAFIDGDLTLAFGTGERTDLSYGGDAVADENNRFYVVRDPDPTGAASIPALPYGEGDLTDVTGVATDPDPDDQGFYVVAEDGEKFATGHLISDGFAITTSYRPDDGTGDACDAAGTAFVWIFDLAAGAGFFEGGDDPQGRRLQAGLGVPANPRISVGADGEVTLFLQTSSGRIVDLPAPSADGSPVELVYWKQEK